MNLIRLQCSISGTTTTPLMFDAGYHARLDGRGSPPGHVTINGSVKVKNQSTSAVQASSSLVK